MRSIVPLTIAWRYLTGKKNGNAVPLLSKVSMVAIGIGAAALIILFSVSNGFGDLIKNLYNVFYPELLITPSKGKFATINNSQLKALQNLKGIKYLTPVIEDNVLLEANEEQLVATIKGVQPTYFRVHRLDSFIIDGFDTVTAGQLPTAIVGAHIAGDLGIDVNNVFSLVHLFYPNGTDPSYYSSPEQAFNRLDVKPDGVFRVQEDFDSKIIIAPYEQVAQLLGQEGKWSSLEIQPKEEADVAALQERIKQLLGKGYKVETRYEQNRSLYNIMNSEKLAMYFILVLVLVIASFNMVGALLLLVIEKQKDINIMKAMGMNAKRVGAIFRWEGLLWAFVGGTIGLLLGILLCLGQQKYAWIKMGDSFVIDAYPVALRWADVGIVILTVLLVGLLASLYPAHKAKVLAR